mgnify:CR=1 FL=1
MNIFIYDNYKHYLNDLLDNSTIYGGRGGRKRLAIALNSHLPYITQVLKQSADFSIEQAQAFCEYTQLNELESEYFLTLVELNKTNNENLKKRYLTRLQQIKEKSQNLSQRVPTTSVLSPENTLDKYYSSWLYGAVHMALTIPKYNKNLNLLSKDLGVSMTVLLGIVKDLVAESVIRHGENNSLELTNKILHLGTDSRQINQHHLNWRAKAADLIQRKDVKGVNYSSVVSLSEKDAELIYEKILQFIKETKQIIRDSKEETVYTFCLDFLKVVNGD